MNIMITRTASFAQLIILFACSFSQASTSEAPREYNIAAQPLIDALLTFSEQSGRVVVGLPSTLDGRRSHKLAGNYTADTAISIMLTGTQLIAEANNIGGFLILSLPESSTIKNNAIDYTPANTSEDNIEELMIIGQANRLRPIDPLVTSNRIEFSRENSTQLNNTESLANNSPNLFIAPGADLISGLAMRGIGNHTDAMQATLPVTFHYNGSYISAFAASSLQFFDMRHIDIARGAQMSLRGRSSVAGGIYAEAVAPETQENHVYATFQTGNYAHRSYQVAANLSPADTVAFRLALIDTEREGFTEIWPDYNQLATNRPSLHYAENPPTSKELSIRNYTDYIDKQAWRLSSLWQYSDTGQIMLRVEQHADDSSPPVFLDPYIVDNYRRATVIDTPTQRQSQQSLAGLDITQQFNQSGISYFYRHSVFDLNSTRDNDLGRSNWFHETRIIQHEEKKQSHTLEWYSLPSTGSWSWLAGLYREQGKTLRLTENDGYLNSTEAQMRFSGIIYDPHIFNTLTDLYFQSNWRFTNATSAALSLRYMQNKREVYDAVNIECAQNLKRPVIAGNTLLPHNTYALLKIFNPRENGGSSNESNLPCNVLNYDNNDNHWRKPVYRFGLHHNFNKQHSSALSLSTGFRPGIVWADRVIPYQQSKNIDWRLSGKIEKHDLSYDLTLFASRHINMLVLPYDRTNQVINWGAEFSLNKTIYGGKLDISGSYLRTEIKQLEAADYLFNGQKFSGPASDDSQLAERGYIKLKGNELPFSPRAQLNIHYKKAFTVPFGQLIPGAGLQLSESYYLDVFNNDNREVTSAGRTEKIDHLAYQPGHILTNLYLTWIAPNENIELHLSIQNLQNRQIKRASSRDYYSHKGQPAMYANPRLASLTLAYFWSK